MPRIFNNIKRQHLPALQASLQTAQRKVFCISYDKNTHGEHC